MTGSSSPPAGPESRPPGSGGHQEGQRNYRGGAAHKHKKPAPTAAYLEDPPGLPTGIALLTDGSLLGIPTVIVTVVRTLPATGPISADQLQAMVADLLEIVRGRHFTLRADGAGLDIEKVQGQPAPSRSYTGLDGISRARHIMGISRAWPARYPAPATDCAC